MIVMDGVGRSADGIGDAVSEARTPAIDKLLATCPHTYLKAHGTAVGLPSDDDMGNSEVGHNALGCGQIYSQGAKLVNESISSGAIYASKAWTELRDNCLKNSSVMHFIGLLSDGNVHSNISHLLSMLEACKAQGIKKARVHILLDGRDVPATKRRASKKRACISFSTEGTFPPLRRSYTLTSSKRNSRNSTPRDSTAK